MDQTNQKPKNRIWLICGAVYAVVLLFMLFIANLDAFNGWLGKIMTVLRPVLIGLVLAYFCNPVFRLFERKLFFKVRPNRLRRVLSLIFTYLVVLLIIVFFLLLLIPQLISSIMSFVENYDFYMSTVIDQINDMIVEINQSLASKGTVIPYLDAKEIKGAIADFLASIDSDFIVDILQKIDISYVGGLISDIFSIILDIIFGFFISLYLLNTKEKRYAQVMRARKALFSDAVNERITRVCTISNRSFGGFFRGKLLDSFIIGILIYIAISLYGIEYPLLIATIIAITDIIPIIGPIIGVFPSGFIILLSQPEKLIPFIIIVILVQQLDANIVSPKILGENTGVSSLCVIIAIC
ncbi:MAG: AI-2E family transporter, partial [Clostridia bacterium]|nr:AI-2E family transporter [Clostridia bacterium]